MSCWRRDQDGVSPVMATLMLVVVVIVISAGVFVLTADVTDEVGEVPAAVALTTVPSESSGTGWMMKLAVAVPARPVDEFLFIVRTPQNGTLVATPASPDFADDRDFYFQLGSSAGTGAHQDNESTVGSAGLGGFRIALQDLSGDGRLGGGDRLALYYDGDGDQLHAMGPDDRLPGGIYTFEIKSKRGEHYVGLDERSF